MDATEFNLFFCKTNTIKWRDLIGGSRIKTLKMLGAVGGLFYLYLGGKRLYIFYPK